MVGSNKYLYISVINIDASLMSHVLAVGRQPLRWRAKGFGQCSSYVWIIKCGRNTSLFEIRLIHHSVNGASSNSSSIIVKCSDVSLHDKGRTYDAVSFEAKSESHCVRAVQQRHHSCTGHRVIQHNEF